ncbi:MAG: hypothetical protein SFV54_00245 [Bryobacteraceae bacterium]|nr:hypothetical protein [Bryobacteraceae bacterium]
MLSKKGAHSRVFRLSSSLCCAALMLGATACSGRRPVRIAAPNAVDAVTDWRKAVSDEIKQSFTGAPTAPEDIRNKALSFSEALVVARYGNIRESLSRGRAVSAVAFDALNIGLTAAVPIVNGSRGKTILGALATGFQGVNNSIDKNVFQQQTTGALLTAMDSCVARQRAVLAQRRLLPFARYDEYNAYSDLVVLYGCTTLAGMVQELTETQAVESKNLKTVLKPVDSTTLTAFQELQAAFVKSLDGDSKAARKFLELLKVPGVTATSTREELTALYRGLLGAAAGSEEFRRTMLQVALDAGLLRSTN